MIRAMYGVTLIGKRSNEELQELLGLEATLDRIVKANKIRWYGHVMRSNSDSEKSVGF